MSARCVSCLDPAVAGLTVHGFDLCLTCSLRVSVLDAERVRIGREADFDFLRLRFATLYPALVPVEPPGTADCVEAFVNVIKAMPTMREGILHFAGPVVKQAVMQRMLTEGETQ